MKSRERSRLDLFETLKRELPHAARVLLRTPSFSLIAFVTLALGIGATTAIYTVLDAVALRPLPYRNGDRLVSVLHPATVPGNGESKWGMSSGGYFTFKAENKSFEDLGGYTTDATILLDGQGAEEARTADVTASIFSTLQANAALGRLIGPGDDTPGAPAVAVLSYEFWQRHFGGDRAVLGTMLQTNDGPREIIGVAERGLALPKPGPFASTADLAGFGVDLWMPLQLNPNGPFQNSHQYSGIGRLRAGVSAEAAQRDLTAIMREFPAKLPNAYSDKFMQSFNFRVAVQPLRDEVLGPKLAKSLWVLFGAVALVLCIACANIANLFLVRMESRRRESAIRTALGADRARMAVHFLSESLLLTVCAGIAGVVLARAGLGAILAIAPTDVPRLATVGLGWPSVAFAMALAVIAGTAFGVLPLARTGVDVNTLREGGRGLTSSVAQRVVRSGLVVGQVALALILLAASGLMLRSFANLRNVKPGLDPRGVLTFSTILDGSFRSAEAVAPFLQQFQARLAALPGVVSAGASAILPLQDYGSGCTAVLREGVTLTGEKTGACIATPSVLPGFFESLGIQVRGRTPQWTDRLRRERPGIDGRRHHGRSRQRSVAKRRSDREGNRDRRSPQHAAVLQDHRRHSRPAGERARSTADGSGFQRGFHFGTGLDGESLEGRPHGLVAVHPANPQRSRAARAARQPARHGRCRRPVDGARVVHHDAAGDRGVDGAAAQRRGDLWRHLIPRHAASRGDRRSRRAGRAHASGLRRSCWATRCDWRSRGLRSGSSARWQGCACSDRSCSG